MAEIRRSAVLKELEERRVRHAEQMKGMSVKERTAHYKTRARRARARTGIALPRLQKVR